MLNFIWIAFILVGSLAALAQALQGDLEIFSRVLTGLFDSAKTGFDISIGLVGVMSLWLGIMKIGEKGGLIALFDDNADFRHPERARALRRGTQSARVPHRVHPVAGAISRRRHKFPAGGRRRVGRRRRGVARGGERDSSVRFPA